MKKTLATLLVFAMVMSVCGMLFVSADEPVNLAAGKSYTTTAIYTTDGVQNWPDEGGVTLTDGVKAASDAGFSDPVWVGFNAQSADYDKAEGGYGATTVIDLGAVCDLDKIAFQAFGGDAGISTPYWINLYVSDDGENFTSAGYIENDPSKSPAGVSQFACDVDVSGRYVKVCFYLYGWGFIDEIEVFGTAAASAPEVELVKPEAAIELENTLAEKIVDSEDAAFNWDVEATVEGDKVTVVVTAKDMYELDSQIVFVDAWLRYNSNELVLLTADGKDGLECITSPDLSNKAWENASSAMDMPLADDADDFEKSFDRVVSMSVMTFEDGYCFTEESPVIFTLEFQFVEGVTVAGLFIDADESSCLDIDMSDVYCNGGYTVAYVPVEVPVEPEVSEPEVSEPDEPSEPETPAVPEEWADKVVEGENGNYTANNPYGYTWTVNYVDGKIGGEDVTVVTTDDAYKACNPNWAITVLLEKQADGSYVAVQNAIVTPGNANAITIGENQIALVAHSAYSNPNGANWLGKVFAMSVKAGDVFNVDLDALTVTAIDPATVEPEVPENLAAGKEWTGDTDIGSSYKGDITDGVIDPSGKYDTSIWYGFDQRPSGDQIATIIIDLGNVYTNLDQIRAHVWPAGASGIAVPQHYNFYISEDGENYTLVSSIAGEKSNPCWVGTDNTDVLTARYIKLEIVGTASDTFWFIDELEVNSYDPKIVEVETPDEPVENTKADVTVEGILTDGKTGFDGDWGTVGTGDVVLVTNGNCTAAGMDVTLSYALGEAKKINGVTVDLYHCANVMIGYPEGQATVLVSVDGETWTEVGKYDLAAAEVALGAHGTVSNAFAFDEVEAAYVKVLLYAGSNEAVLGTEPAGGKIFWEFIAVAEVAVSEVTEPDEPDEPIEGGKDILVSHVNAYTWGVYNMMIITGEGENCVSKLGYDCTWWIAIKVDNVDGVYTVTQIEGNGDAKSMTASADGFILYCYSNDAASFAAAQSVVVGDILLNSTVDWSQNAASETPIGTLTFGAAPSEPEEPSVEPSEPEEPSEDSSDVVVPPAGDAGILLFAILGVLAIAGAAVVIRVRN